jgi:Flp pilus assembly protein TadG
MTTSRGSERRQHGQVLVVFAVAVVALLAMTGLVVDGGNAFSQQRITQNSVDAAAEAGSVVLVQYYAGATAPSTGYSGTCPTSTTDPWDLAVCQSVYGAGATNGVTINSAYYTNSDGSTNLGTVGQGSVPNGAQGVRTQGERQFSTYLIGVVGINSLTAGGGATAVVGKVSTFCPPDTICGMLPVTVPVLTSSCYGNHTLQVGDSEWPVTSDFVAANEAIVPLCQNGPGSVGWLQWPCETQNGSPGLLDEINDPCVQNITLPIWVDTYTGNTNSPNIESALNAYDGKTVLIPQFDAVRGTGSTLQYHITQLHAFRIDVVYTNGNNHPECNSAPGSPYIGGNGANGCFKGWWTEMILTGTIDLGDLTVGTDQPLGVQLIK